MAVELVTLRFTVTAPDEMVTGLVIVAVRPVGEGLALSETDPVYPFKGVIVMGMVQVLPVPHSTGDGALLVTVKSTTWNRIELVVLLRAPLVPVTVTV